MERKGLDEPNQVLHQNRRPALQRRVPYVYRTLDSLPEFVASGGR